MPHIRCRPRRIGPLLAGQELLGTITVIEDVTQREFHAATLRRQHAEEAPAVLGAWPTCFSPRIRLRDIAALFPRVSPPRSSWNCTPACCSIRTARRLRLHSSGGLTAARSGPEAFQRLSPIGECRSAASAPSSASPSSSIMCRPAPILTPHAARVKDLGVRAYAGFPLVLGDTLLGTLAFATRSAATRSALSEVEFLSTIAQYVAIALDRRAAAPAAGSESDGAAPPASHETISQLESFSYTLACTDLRAPIRALKGYCEVLMEDFACGAAGRRPRRSW